MSRENLFRRQAKKPFLAKIALQTQIVLEMISTYSQPIPFTSSEVVLCRRGLNLGGFKKNMYHDGYVRSQRWRHHAHGALRLRETLRWDP
jgi:hypothetical protein